MTLSVSIKALINQLRSSVRLTNEMPNPPKELRPSNSYLESILGKEFLVLDHGFIRIVDYMGDDSSIVQAARVSYGSGTKSVRSDRGLIRYLLRKGHWSPFEMCTLKYHVKLPLFVARQWIRHQGSVNEYSARYSELSNEHYLPELLRISKQSTANKQGSGEKFSELEAEAIQEKISSVYEFAENVYRDLNKRGLSRELARIIKATGGYTEWYWSTNLRDLLHFCRQRCDNHAQSEIRSYATVLRDDVLKYWVPDTYSAYIDYIQDAVTLSGPQQRGLIKLLSHTDNSVVECPKELTKSEWAELCQWYNALKVVGSMNKQQ